ncbi:MAG: hypothetical protein KY459_05490 [Acidobacteria bacterium]|nr:hypothetical protein [Acidobacteriota bacterium]
MKRILLIAVPILLLAVIGIGLVEFDSPELGRLLLSRLGERAEMDLQADELRVSLLRGVTIRNMRGSSTGVDRDLDLEIETVRLEHRLLPLLRGEWVFDRIEIESPRIELQTSASGELFGAAAVPAALAIPDEESSEARMVISSILITDGNFVVVSDGETGLAIRGFRLELDELRLDPAASAVEGLSGHGTLVSDSIQLGDLIARDSSGPLTLQNGTLILNGHQFATELGEFEAEVLEIDPAAEPFTYRLILKGDPLHVASLLGGSGEGETGEFFLEGTGAGPEKDGLRGDGRVHLPGGEVPSSPYLALIESLLGGVPIAGERWEPADVDFEIAESTVRLLPFTIALESAQLDIEGAVDLEGPLNLDVRVGAPRAMVRVKEIPDELVDILTDERGYVSIPLVMRGTIEEPRIRPDWNELARIGRSNPGRVLESLEKGLRSLLD